MNRWLAEESKWAREQALAATRRAELLADPAWVARRRKEIARDQTTLHEFIDRHLRLIGEAALLIGEAALLDDPDAIAREIERHQRDAQHWQTLAEEQSARLAASEDHTEPLFDDEGGS